jgi:uncharacterized protein YjbI with pentapeptide repeats
MDTLMNTPSLTIFALSIVAVWWFLPKYQKNRLLRHPSLERKDIEAMEDEYRKTVTQALGGVFVVAALLITYLQLSEARHSTEAQLKSAQRNLDIQVAATLFAKGFDLLGSNTEEQRVGGIRILDEWINDDGDLENLTPEQKNSALERRYELVVPALVVMIRRETQFPPPRKRCEEFERPRSVRTAEDVQAALNVISPWSKFPRREPLHLDYLNLSEADLSGFDLDKTHLEYSDLSGADLSRATFKAANLYCANMYNANLKGSDFSSTAEGETVLAGALLTQAQMEGTLFLKTNLRSANFTATYLYGVNFSGADLFNADFEKAVLKSPIFDENTDIKDACFVGTIFDDASVKGLKNAQSALVAAAEQRPDPVKSHCYKQQLNGILDDGQ